jgi:hypothetical protein
MEDYVEVNIVHACACAKDFTSTNCICHTSKYGFVFNFSFKVINQATNEIHTENAKDVTDLQTSCNKVVVISLGQVVITLLQG